MSIRGIAHRGFPTRYPENTRSSFQAALDNSFTHMELDVHLSKDGVPVVIHDLTVNRTTNGKGKVASFTLAELKQLKLGEQGEETIPTLAEVFELARGRIRILVELKQFADTYPGLEQKVLETADQVGVIDQLIITSFDHYALVNVRKLHSGVDIGLLMSGVSPAVYPFMKELRSTYMSIPLSYLSEREVLASQEHGVQLISRPVDDEAAMNKLLRYPSVLASTNTMELWKQFVERHRDVWPCT